MPGGNGKIRTARSRPFTWSRERRWVVGLGILIAGYLALVWSLANLSAPTTAGGPTRGEAGRLVILMVISLTAVLVGTLVFLMGLLWRWRGWPRRERAMAEQIAAAERERDEARRLYWVLTSPGRQLVPLAPGATVLYDGEAVHLGVSLWYSRLTTAGDGSYMQTMALGTGSLGLGLVAGSMIGNARRREQAARDAQLAWRWHEFTYISVTDQRVICWTAYGQWSFDWAAVSAFYPDLASGAVVFEFGGRAEPLQLAGRGAAQLIVYATWRLRPWNAFTDGSLATALGIRMGTDSPQFPDSGVEMP